MNNTKRSQKNSNNFSIHKNPSASAVVEDISTQISSKIVITFGSSVDVLDENNKIIYNENPKNINMILNKEQARDLFVQLKDFLQNN